MTDEQRKQFKAEQLKKYYIKNPIPETIAKRAIEYNPLSNTASNREGNGLWKKEKIENKKNFRNNLVE